MVNNCKSRLVLCVILIAGSLSSCSLDPNVRKENDFANGKSYMKKGNYRAAAIDFVNAIRIDPNYVDAHLQLAKTYLKMQQPDRAYQEFANVVQLAPANYQARIAMTNLLISSRRLREAQVQTTLLLQQKPNDPSVHAIVAALMTAKGNDKGAIGELQKAIALSPGKWPPYLSLALLQWKDDQPDAAEASVKKVIELTPHSAQPRILLGTYYESQGHLSDAEQQFRNAVAADATSMDARKALAGLYLSEGKQSESESILLQANHDLPNDPESYLALSNFYFVIGNQNNSVAEYEILYHKWPNDIQLKKNYIQLLIQTKRFGEARQLDQEILKSTPGDSDALLYRSEMEISNGQLADAIPTLQTLIENAPDNSEAHYALGLAFRDQGKFGRAQEEWQKALRLNPNSRNAERAIADLAMEQGNMSALQTAATGLIRLEPASPEGYALRALSSINLKQFDQAETDIQKAIIVAPQSSYGYVQLGNLRLAQGNYGDAVQAYRSAMERNSNSVDAVRGLASAYIAEKELDKAIAVVNSSIAGSPTDSSLYDLLGAILFHDKRDLSGAETAFKKATALNRQDVNAWMQLCEAIASQGRVDEAISIGGQALQAIPGQIGLYLLLGDLYQSKADWNDARKAYQNALVLNPQNPPASMGMAQVMSNTGENLDVALSFAQTARREMPSSPLAADTAGWIYYQQGLYSLALSSLENALKLQESGHLPDNPELHYHLGMTYAKMKQIELARQQLKLALRMNSGNPKAALIRQELSKLKS
jgi:tetratricopeptide (TPR) repeat protein